MSHVDSLSQWGQAPMPVFLPWQQSVVQTLLSQQKADRLSHAYLFTAQTGTGGLQFIYALAAGLLCKQPAGLIACGQCKSCTLMQSGGHPDGYLIAPENSKVIKIDQIRKIIQSANETAQQGGYRVILVSPAETLNPNAANALLKLLEEPGAKTVLLMLSYAPATIPATVRSRCQKVHLPQPSLAQAQAWWQSRSIQLEDEDQHFYATQPLLAIDAYEAGNPSLRHVVASSLVSLTSGEDSPAEFAKKINKTDLLAALDVLYSLCVKLCKEQGSAGIFEQLDELVSLRRQLLSGATINTELYLQSWAIKHIK